MLEQKTITITQCFWPQLLSEVVHTHIHVILQVHLLQLTRDVAA